MKRAIYSKILGHLFNPDAGFSLLGHFIGLFCNIFTQVLGLFFTQMLDSACWVILLLFFFICFTQVLGSFSVTKLLGYFFYPNAELSLSPIKQNVSQLCQQ